MDACHHGLFFITGALIGVGFTAYVCWQFLLRAAAQSGRERGYERGWAEAYSTNGEKIPASMGMWQWPYGSRDGKSFMMFHGESDASPH